MGRGYERIQEDLEVKDWIEEAAEKDPLSLFYIYAHYVLKSSDLANRVFRIWKGKNRMEYFKPIIKQLTDKGYTVSQISKILNVPLCNLLYYQNTISFNKRWRCWTDEEKTILRQCILEDMDVREALIRLKEAGFKRGYEGVKQELIKLRKEMENDEL